MLLSDKPALGREQQDRQPPLIFTRAFSRRYSTGQKMNRWRQTRYPSWSDLNQCCHGSAYVVRHRVGTVMMRRIKLIVAIHSDRRSCVGESP